MMIAASAQKTAWTGVELRQGRAAATWLAIDSWAHASALVRDFITSGDLTASGATGPTWTGGRIKDGTGKVVATVSYNGKVWDEPTDALLYDPYGEGRT